MKRFVFTTSFFAGTFLAAVPAAAHAASATFFGPIVSDACNCPGAAAGFGCVMDTLHNIVNFGISIACIIAVLVLVYGGFLLIASAANPENRTKATKLMVSAFIGLVIVLAAWLIVDFVMKTFYGGQFGPWNSILGTGDKCIVAQQTQKLFNGTIASQLGTIPGSPGGSGTSTNPGGDGSGGDIPSKICAAANSYRGQSTTGCNCNGNACAWSVNNVLQNAGLARIGDKQVSEIEAGLNGGRGTAISQSSGVCGDIVIVHAGGRNHVGICLNAGCTQAISNSSTNHSFSWISPSVPGSHPIFYESYDASAPRLFYRVTN